MSNLPQSLSMGAAFGGGGAPPQPSSVGGGAQGSGAGKDRKMASAEQLVLELSNPELRENALLELSKLLRYHAVAVFTVMRFDVVCGELDGCLEAVSPVRCLFLSFLESLCVFVRGKRLCSLSSQTCVRYHTPLLLFGSCLGILLPMTTTVTSPFMAIEIPSDSASTRTFSNVPRTNTFCAQLSLWKRELFQDLAPLLWNSFGTIAALLQEIVSIYPVLSPPNLTPAQSNRVCNALALLQCVASHPDTRMLFLNAHIPLYLYPFLNTTSKSRPFEYLRLTSLGVIGALVKVDDTEVISFLLSTEIIPLCLRTMEMGSELSKTVEFSDSLFLVFGELMPSHCLVATFIVQKILLDDVGLDYICTTAERFFAVGRVLGNMVAALAEQPSSRLLKHIIRCYLRLSDNPRACDALRSCLPDMLRDATFSTCLREDPTTRRWLQQLLHNVGGNRVPALQAGGGFDHMIVT
ncbi:hypothetical protein JHK87_023084 [Glycine soja]|nr:hypothetical protein JHK87_023084 [Glycine soja]